MSIRLAQVTDIPVLKELLNQIFQVHQTVRPDLFKNTDKGSKYSETELKELLQDESKPIFVYTDGKNRVLGHLFLVIKETEGSSVSKPCKTLVIAAMILLLMSGTTIKEPWLFMNVKD